MKCEDCKFWEYMDTYEREPKYREWGFCHRYPPSVKDEGRRDEDMPRDDFPASEGTDWCGEFVLLTLGGIRPIKSTGDWGRGYSMTDQEIKQIVEALREQSDRQYHPSDPKAKLTLENKAADLIEKLAAEK